MYNLVAGMTTTFAQVRDWEGLQRYREKKKKNQCSGTQVGLIC